MANEVRIDKFMWATRIFKSRTIAVEACKKGRVTMGEITVKSSRMVRVGDVIAVRKPPVIYSFRILALADKRMGAKLVPDYIANVTSPDQLAVLERLRLEGFTGRSRGEGRPTKRDARQLQQFVDPTWEDDDFDFDFDFDQE